MRTQVYTKINTLYCRYKNLGKVELPNKQWIKFQNKIIIDDFSDDYMDYIKDLKFDCFSKIDGTNSKIVYLPSTGKCFCGGKTDNADIIGTGQKAMLDQIIERIKPILAEMFPPECARFTPVLNDKNQIQYYEAETGTKMDVTPETVNEYRFGVQLEEVPVYIYGEFYGKGVQKCGGNYDKDNKRFSVFDICQQGWYVPIDMLEDYCAKLGLDIAPYIGQMTISEAERMVVNGFKTRVANASNPDFIEEGIVARPIIPIKDPRGNRIIVKIKHCDYDELNAVINELGILEYDNFHKWYMDNREAIEGIK
jgi:hypothetical protein